jgi:hypothetical protein
MGNVDRRANGAETQRDPRAPWRRTLVPAAILVLATCGEACAHITTSSPYKTGVNEHDWALVSNGIFAAGQLLGWGYLAAVLHAERRRLMWKNLLLATFVQSGVALGMCIAGVVSFLFAVNPLASELHIIPSGYEIAALFDPKHVPKLVLANLLTFAVGWGWSLALLFVVRGMRRRWVVALFHALVFHPFAFPIGPLAGLIYVLHVRQTPVAKPAG